MITLHFGKFCSMFIAKGKVIWVLQLCVVLGYWSLNHCDCNLSPLSPPRLSVKTWWQGVESWYFLKASLLFVVCHLLSLSFSLDIIRQSSPSYSLSPLLGARPWPRTRSWSGCRGSMTVIFSCTSEPQGEPFRQRGQPANLRQIINEVQDGYFKIWDPNSPSLYWNNK